MKIQIDHVTTFEDIDAIVGQNYEMADMGNPQGYIYGTEYKAAATTKEGRRFFHGKTFDCPDQCDALVEKIKAKGIINTEHWAEDDQGVYGSEVWQHRDAQRRQGHLIRSGGNVRQREI